MRTLVLLCALSALTLVACDDGSVDVDAGADAATDDAQVPPPDANGHDAGVGLVVPPTYTFESRFAAGQSSVVHTGQTARHVLIQDLKAYIGGLTDEVDSGFSPAADGDVTARLDYFFSLDGADRAADPIRLTTDPATLQMTYGDISDANLVAKLAGNDAVTDHRDWSTEFSGWSDAAIAAHGGGVDTPENLLRAFFETLEENAIQRAAGVDRLSPAGEPLPVHVTESGLDLQQLTAKFLLGAVAFSQGADDYTDDDTEGKGLLSDNTTQDGEDPYTALEHAWDEAYGYFGAAERYGDWTAESLAAGPVYMDADESGSIDLTREYNFGASVNAAKRDAGASAATDFMGQASLAFRTGRAIITQADGALDAEAAAALAEQRDLAIGAWEAAIAATVVHYINDTLQVMADFGTAAYDHARFLDHAKVWSEMKGFALMFQFNPRSPLSPTQFAELHSLMGDAPVLPAAGDAAADAYRADLVAARALLGAAYGFDAENLGDDAGENGW